MREMVLREVPHDSIAAKFPKALTSHLANGKPCLYLVGTKDREQDSRDDFEHWMQMVESGKWVEDKNGVMEA